MEKIIDREATKKLVRIFVKIVKIIKKEFFNEEKKKDQLGNNSD